MDNKLYHHGILGQKWGVRRYQNADGTLTDAGKKKYSAAYKKESAAAMEDLKRSAKHGPMQYYKIYNKAADRMNNGEIDKFNKEQKKKYGENFGQRDGYVDDYERLFNKIFAEEYNKTLVEAYASSKHYQKAQEYAKKYNMTSWDDLAKSNAATIRELEETVKKYK